MGFRRNSSACHPAFSSSFISTGPIQNVHFGNVSKSLSTIYKTSQQRRVVKPVMTAPPTETKTAVSVPQSLRDANVLIVGGGPSGSLAAMLLHQRGISATLIEREPNFLQFNVPKSYALGIFGRGWKSVLSVPGLSEFLLPFAMPNDYYSFNAVTSDGVVTTSKLPRPKMSSPGIVMFLRFRLLHVLKTFVLERTNVSTMYGCSVEHIDFKHDGSMDVRVTCKDASSQTLNTRFIIACDGKNSLVVKHLREASERADADKRFVHSIRGFAENCVKNPSVGVKIKSVILDRRSLDKIGVKTDDNGRRGVVALRGDKKGRRKQDVFSVTVWSIGERDKDICDGLLSSIPQPPDHSIWKLNTIGDAYKLFQENFPQLDIQACISRDSMRKFVDTKANSFPMITRPESLVATIGKPATGGVVILGDAAHCFPPNLGLGVNAGFEDASVLMRIIDEAMQGDSIAEIVKRYEAARDDDTWALLKIIQYHSRHTFNYDGVRKTFSIMQAILQTKLSSWFPRIFYPTCRQMIVSELSFSEIWRRGNKSATHIMALVVLVITVPIIAFFLAFLS